MPAAEDLHINYKEVCAVVQAVSRWAPRWCGKSVIVHTDSTVTKSIINKGRSRNPYINCLLRKMAWECVRRNCDVSAVHVSGSVNVVADTISRDEPSLREQLLREVADYRSRAFAENTKKTYQTHLRSYLQFCEAMNIQPVPVSETTIAQYAAFLARKLQPTSVAQYLNIVRLLHLECGKPHPFDESWLVKSTLRGIEKVKGCAPNRKAPMTPQLLLQLKKKLNLARPPDCFLGCDLSDVFWTASEIQSLPGQCGFRSRQTAHARGLCGERWPQYRHSRKVDKNNSTERTNPDGDTAGNVASPVVPSNSSDSDVQGSRAGAA
ncbi:hypothetical protein BaRGS_00037873 [Batillaria attramentaria]|uniref:Core-binding (CB) domain-containing protein n=1 Tax=Batillaria attramentaria TaxID=370345 RepID=A0ABD0J7P4_9CAEN